MYRDIGHSLPHYRTHDASGHRISCAECTYSGPPIDDPNMLTALPQELASSLQIENGFVAASGGLHVRGACLSPEWHSLRAAWKGGERLPGQLLSVDPPFVARECVNPSLKPIPALELRAYLADFAKQIQNLPDGSKTKIVVK